MNRDYAGNIVYETEKKGATVTNSTKILVDGGYIENGVYYFYQTDHLGNNRVVANASGTAIQKNHYYPFGTAFADKYDNGKNQPYKYNGKELDQMHGLNLYDYSTRYYEPALVGLQQLIHMQRVSLILSRFSLSRNHLYV